MAANQDAQIPSITHSAGSGRKQASAVSSNKSSKNSLCASKQSTALEITSILHDNSHASGRVNIKVPLPAFERAFGSTDWPLF
jgi:hypothetical protein